MAVGFSSIAGLTGMLPPRFMAAFMLGYSLNGLGLIALRVVTLFSFDILNEVRYFYGSLIYFAISAGFLMICACGIFIVIR